MNNINNEYRQRTVSTVEHQVMKNNKRYGQS